MKIYTRRNAAVGYLVLKRARYKRQRRLRGLKVAAYVGLGLVSAGILAGLLAIALKHRSGQVESEADPDGESEIVGEYVTAPEPVPAT